MASLIVNTDSCKEQQDNRGSKWYKLLNLWHSAKTNIYNFVDDFLYTRLAFYLDLYIDQCHKEQTAENID